MSYVIYLSECHIDNPDRPTGSVYGYWTGKNYTRYEQLFPGTTGDQITGQTKRYKTRKGAELGLKACLDRPYAYVSDASIVEIIDLEKIQQEIHAALKKARIILEHKRKGGESI